MSKSFIVIDLGFGDCGKGTITDFLTSKFNCTANIRYNGGCQAGHNVVTPDGLHHEFSQFGSGTFNVGTKSILSKDTVLDPISMMLENDSLNGKGINDALSNVYVDPRAKIASPFQKAANRIKELHRNRSRHGSCGKGVGETISDSMIDPELVVVVGDINNLSVLKKKLSKISEFKKRELRDVINGNACSTQIKKEFSIFYDEKVIDFIISRYVEWFESINLLDSDTPGLKTSENVVFEGAQGMLLDETHGFFPHTTWTDITSHNAKKFTEEFLQGPDVTKIGVIRTLTTRHGAGPLPTEDLHLKKVVSEPHNHTGVWQGAFRIGYFDAIIHEYACRMSGGIDCLAITHLDTLKKLKEFKVCVAYKLRSTNDIVEAISLGCKIESKNILRQIPNMDGDLERMNRLTNLLCRVEPLYLNFSNTEKYIQYISNFLNVPIWITSEGPTRLDKKIR